METSYNGWPASPDGNAIDIVDLVVNGTSFPGGCHGGDVHTVFAYLVAQFHARVEPLHPGWCWGYEYRQNRNANNLSCHASGTAIDFNAPSHPNGAAGTYSAEQVRAIREIQAELMGVVYWGGDFSGTKDEMHFEINGTPGQVTAAARKVLGASAPPEHTTVPEIEDDDDMIIVTTDPHKEKAMPHLLISGSRGCLIQDGATSGAIRKALGIPLVLVTLRDWQRMRSRFDLGK